LICNVSYGQDKQPPSDSLATDIQVESKFDRINTKMEAAFKIIPAPIISYSQEAGNVFGLAKFNTFRLNRHDTISGYSKISEVATFSTKGQINVSVATTLSMSQNKWLILGFVNYKELPEYILGIGNNVDTSTIEQIITTRLKFSNSFLYRIYSKLFVGVALDLTNTFAIEKDSTSFLIREDYTGKDGGVTTGFGFMAAWDSRDNRYNSFTGSFLSARYLKYSDITGSGFNFSKFEVDLRKYYNPWYKHVIAIQAATNYSWGDVPFYELSLLGGEERMRGFYKGALRDKALIDCQIEYRMPIWKVFGITGWVGTGRVAPSYSDLSLNGLWLNYGVGFRIKVDSGSDINLRMDLGFGSGRGGSAAGIKGFYLNFSEAF
jgi:hypothetical protein